MGRGKAFQCEITVSPGVREKLSGKHHIEIWEIEEIIYDDPRAFSITHEDCHFVYGQTFAGRYLLALVRILMKGPKKLSDMPPMTDDELEDFWGKNEPEDYEGWEEGLLAFKRPPKKLIQLRLDPRDVRIIDRESKRSGIDRAQLVRSWVKEKIGRIEEGHGS